MNQVIGTATVTLLLPLVMVLAEETEPEENLEKTIIYLLECVSKSDCTFIRNGTPYNGKQASVHIRRKYQYFKKEIRTPEDFIRLAATKSLQTGQPYMVKTKEGKELRCDEWMKRALEEYRKAKKDKKEQKDSGQQSLPVRPG